MRAVPVIGGLALLLPGTVALAEEPAVDPKAMEIATAAAGYLAGQQKFTFTWFVSYDEVIEGREKITYFRSGRAAMDRAEGFVMATEQATGLRDYYFDGETFTVAAPDEDFYATAPFEGDFDALVAAARERTGAVPPLWSVMSPTLADWLTEGVETGAYLGETLIAGQPVHHLAFSEYDEDWQAWISTDPERPVLVMLIGTDPYEQGWPQFRAYFADWDVAPDFEPGMFTFAPDPDDRPVAMPELVATTPEDAGGSGDDAPASGTPSAE